MPTLFIVSIRFASVAKTPRVGLNDGVEHMVGQWLYEKMADSYWAGSSGSAPLLHGAGAAGAGENGQ